MSFQGTEDIEIRLAESRDKLYAALLDDTALPHALQDITELVGGSGMLFNSVPWTMGWPVVWQHDHNRDLHRVHPTF